MKLLSLVVLLAYVLGHHNSSADCGDGEISPSDCDCSASCSPCQTNNCCNNKCDCCQTTTSSPITTTTKSCSTTTRSPITTTTNPYSTTTSRSSTGKPPSDETNIDIKLVNVINTTNDINVPIDISLTNRNNVIQLQSSSSNSTACRRRQCAPSTPEGTDWETITNDPPPRIELPPSTTISSIPDCPDSKYPCQKYSFDGLLGQANQQTSEASPDLTEGGVYGIPISTPTATEQSEVAQPLVYNWLRQLQALGLGQVANVPNNELQGLGYGVGQETPYNQLGGYQPLGTPYNQPLGSFYERPQESSYVQLPLSSYNQPPWSSYNQAPWSSYNQPSWPSYNQPLGSSYNTLMGTG